MSSAAAIFALFLASLVVARWIAVPALKRFAVHFHIVSFVALFLTTAIVNDWIPFSGGGDDADYFRSIDIARSWSDLSSPAIFSKYYAQPGFAMVLNALDLAFEPGLLAFKTLNLVFFLLLVHVWMRIITEIENVTLARRYAFCCVLLTPLWFYFFFLLKDLLIAFLLSIFVLGAVRTWKAPGAWSAWLFQLLAVVALLPFRAPLAGQALAVITIVLVSRGFGKGAWTNKVVMSVMGAAGAIVIAWLATNPGFLDGLGVESAAGVLGSDAMQERAFSMKGQSSTSNALFPVIYLLSEVSGLNSDTWQVLDGVWLRGLLVLPWIFAVVPLVPFAVLWLLRRVRSPVPSKSRGIRITELRIVATPWVVVAALIMTSAMLSWVVGDTTRWRLADMPAILAAVVGASSGYPKAHLLFVALIWTLSVASFFLLLALLRSS